MTTPPVYPEDTVDPTKLIVNHIPLQYAEEDLKKMFEPFGTIESANVVMDRQTGVSRGFGFVKFAAEESAKKAVEALNGKVVEERAIHVDVSRPPKVEMNLFVGGLAQTAKQEDLVAAFAPFGAVVECNIPPDPATGACRGYGFVRMGTRGAAHAAMEALHGKTVEVLSGTRPLTVKRAESNGPAGRGARYGGEPRGYHGAPRVPLAAAAAAAPVLPAPQQEGVCVFIYNIPHTMDEMGLRELFVKYGTVVRAQVMRNYNHARGSYGASKGYGFVNMATTEEANNAIADLNGRALIPDKPLQVSLKTPKQQ